MAQRRPGSITRRLLVASLTAFPLLLLLTGIAIDRAHHSSLLKAEHERLKLQFFSLLGAMEWQQGTLEMSERLQEPRFSQFRSGLYARVTQLEDQRLWQSPSADSVKLPSAGPPPRPGQALIDDVTVAGQPHFLYRYLAIWEEDSGDIPLLFSIYADKTAFTAELLSFRQHLTLWLGLVLLLAVLLSGAILYWGLKPLRELARELARLEAGQQYRLSQPYPRELLGITNNLNQLLLKEQKQRQRYRTTLADLAHSLKTPLAVLRAEDLDAAARREQLARMENIVAYQLQRAVSSGRQALMQRLPLAPIVEKLANSLRKVYRHRDLAISVQLAGQYQVAMDEQDAMELLGNLLDNACKACRHQVRISAKLGQGTAQGQLLLYIDDDGAGMSQAQHQQLLERGKRGDQYGAGHGIGLAIARDIIESYDASMAFEKAPDLGGTRVVLCLAS